MKRTIATLVVTGAALVAVIAAPASGAAGCVPKVAWHSTLYKAVRIGARTDVPLGRRLGTAAVLGCATTSPPGYSAASAATARHSIFAVDGLRTQVAIAMRGASSTRLFVSTTPATAAEKRVLTRLRGK